MSLRSLYLLSLLAAGGSAQAMSAGEYVAKAGDCTACTPRRAALNWREA